jgi:putative selenate reductase
VCPNDANFTYVLPATSQPIVKVRREGETWVARTEGTLTIAKKLQYGNFADFCNECGNCDVFCPEDGGPYQVKPRFFGSASEWRRFAKLDGFAMESPGPGRRRLLGRIDGRDVSVETTGERVHFRGPGFDVTLEPDDPTGTLSGSATDEIDLTYLRILLWIQAAVFDSPSVNYLNSITPEEASA